MSIMFCDTKTYLAITITGIISHEQE